MSFILVGADIQDLLTVDGDGYILGKVGVGTDVPEGKLDVVSPDMGIVLPRVNDVFQVTDGKSNNAVDGTIVYDTLRKAMMFRINNCWIGLTIDSSGNSTVTPSMTPVLSGATTYIKASNTDSLDDFGFALALSSNGNTLAVGARIEDSNASGINGNESDNSSDGAGAVYVYYKNNEVWSQQAYIKASNSDAGDQFGFDLDLSYDGNTLAVSAPREDSDASGINGDQNDNSNPSSGAVYIFSRTGVNWTQQAYLKASNSEVGDFFGQSLSLSGTGDDLLVGARFEDSNATGVNGNENDNSSTISGAAYVFTRSGTTWTQQAYLKASNSQSFDVFGSFLTISGDGKTAVVSSINEDSGASGINGDQNNDLIENSGAVYVFKRSGLSWAQQAYIKASNTDTADAFGYSLALNHDGNTLAVGAWNEDSNATGINGNELNNSALESGAVYVFIRIDTIWTQQAYIKSSNSESDDRLGRSVNLNQNGNSLIAGAYYEDGGSNGLDMNKNDNSQPDAGAVYVFNRFFDQWSELYYIKATNTDSVDLFGISIDIDLNGNIAVGASIEDSNASGINGDQSNNLALNSGAAYVIK